MHCPSCGTDLPDTAKFCGSCGYQMVPAAVAAPGAQRLAQQAAAVMAAPVASYDDIVSRGVELPVGEIIGEAWGLMKNNIGLLLGGLIVLGLILGAAAMTSVGIVITGPVSAGFTIVCLRLVAGREVAFGNFFDGFKKFVPLLLVNLVMGLLITLGSILLVLPGLYLMVAYMWAMLLVIDRDEEFWPAMQASMKVVNASFGPTLIFVLALVGLNLLGSLACGLGTLVTAPLAGIATVVAYRRVFGLAGGAERLG